MTFTDCTDIAYSIDTYDQDGDLTESGIYLHFDDTRIRIGQGLEDLRVFKLRIELIMEEIYKRYGDI